ncbi:sigma-70 family RNA polymerase sigma factor [Fredinandcohnia quinoae]|uniref:Sigma-70 family RNA polymerase sigma factor n=1 Tax=Fredinandcohnia quinoae TaxID=2918902 RepID=A0AAW5E8B6_9BACI|nr:sigma-70 family RNA polymerase sigma factor [Fredinandcohnia sp. SECRCQ15]
MYKDVPFERLEEKYKPLILTVMKSLSLYRELESFYQIGLIGLWEASKRFVPEKGVQFSTFAYTTIRGKLLDQLKMERRYTEFHQAIGEDHVETLIDFHLVQPFENEWIKVYGKKLTANQLKWLQGRIIEDKSYQEIASEHNVTVEAAKSWGKSAKRKLREMIRE